MRSRKYLFYNLILSIGLIALSGCNSTKTEFNYSRMNFPYSLSSSLSYLIPYENLHMANGEPDTMLKAENISYYIWDANDHKKIAVVLDGAVIYYFSAAYFSDYDMFVNEQVKNFNDVQKIDPFAKIAEGDEKSVSDHLLADGNFLHIVYEKQRNTYIIKEVSTFPSKFPEFTKVVLAVSKT